MPSALALSPHLDDAAFSCGGTLALLARAGWRVTMATVFTASVADPKGFALACQTDKGLGADIDYMALRRDEDRAAADALGIPPPHHLPFREAPHRGYASPPELFAEVRPGDGIVPDLIRAFGELVTATAPDLILAPQAVGGHVDHIQVVRALEILAPETPILWWRDFPYSIREAAPREPLAERFAAFPIETVPYDAAAQAAKHAACAAYASQLGFQFGGVDKLGLQLAREGGVERFRRQGALPGDFARVLGDAG